jgi:hypothetical protein
VTHVLVPTLAGIAWDPQIRGILSVAVGVLVLMGSIYLLLATNVASRLGFLIVLTALCGWMIIHSMIWWLYPPGQGPSGRIPAWDVTEIVYGDLSQSLNEKVHDVDVSNLPPAEDVADMTPEEVDQLNADEAAELNEWRLLDASNASKGEAQTAVDAMLVGGEIPGLEDSTSRVFTYTFETGGKPKRQGDTIWDRVSNRVTNTLRIKNPPHYAIVQLQPAIKQETVAGQPPPTPTADPDAQVISVVLVRDIGQRRVPAALMFISFSAIFTILCTMLHLRDRGVAEHRSAPVPATTGG